MLVMGAKLQTWMTLAPLNVGFGADVGANRRGGLPDLLGGLESEFLAGDHRLGGRVEFVGDVAQVVGVFANVVRRFGEVGEASFDRSLPDELLKNLLYYIGLAESGSEQTDKVKAAYHLDLYLPQGETLEQLRQHYATPGRDLWHAVAHSVIEELKGLQTTLEGMQDEARQPELLRKLADKTSHLAGTLGMIGLGQAAELTRLLGDALMGKKERQEEQTLDDLLHISTHYVRLEKVLEEYARTGFDTTETVFSSGPHFIVLVFRSSTRNVAALKIKSAADSEKSC